MQRNTEHWPYLEKHITAGRQSKGTGGQGSRKGMDHKVSDILTICILMVKASFQKPSERMFLKGFLKGFPHLPALRV